MFIKQYFYIFFILLLSTSAFCASESVRPVEGRAVWIDAASIPTNDKEMSSFVESLAKANVNVLFPETMRRGYTIYPSKFDEQDPKFKGYDPLASLIKEAHARGIEVHPWVWVFRQGYKDNKGPIFNAHPEWMAVNKWGETLSANGGYWICPSLPEARNYLLSVFKEIVINYDVDGLHLDYIRFENQFPTPYCYNDSCRCKFKAEHGTDPMQIDSLSEIQITWHLWRENLINTFIQSVYNEIHALKPKVMISAAVGSRPDNSRESLLQDWVNWVDNKWVDFLTPMAYIAESGKLKDMIKSELEAIDNRIILMPGLGLHTHKTLEQTIAQIQLSRDMNTDGITLFSTSHFKTELIDALAAGPFTDKAEIPFRDPSKRVKTLLQAATRTYKKNPALAGSYLSSASRLLGYIAYRTSDTGYIAPARPPIYIPATVISIPETNVPKTSTAPVIDGKLDEAIWTSAARIKISHTAMGDASPVLTDVLLTYDDENLYIGYIAQEPSISTIKQTVTKRDGPVFYDDSAELFLDPWGKRQEYYQLAVNTVNAQFDSKNNNAAINPNWEATASQSPNGWIIEIAVPFSSLGAVTPKSGDIWYANFGRNRWVSGKPEYLIWSVPYGSFHRPERFGVIKFM